MKRSVVALLVVLSVSAFSGCAGISWWKKGETAADERTSPKTAADFSRQFAKARSLETSGRGEQAREIYRQLIVAYPDRPEPYRRLGIMANRLRRHKEAESLFAEAIRRRPADASLFNDLGYCFLLQGKFDKAESALIKATKLAPSEGRYHNNLGLAYGHRGREEEALKSFRRAGSEADAQYNMAFVHAAKNDAEAAKQCFHLAIQADPGHEKSRHALRAFERFDRVPEELLADVGLGENGVRYVPYIEGSGNSSQQAAFNVPAAKPADRSASPRGPANRRDTRVLQAEVRRELQTRLARGAN